MTKDDDAKERVRRRHEVSRTTQFFSLLIAAVAVLNGLMYWERGSSLALVVCVVSVVALVVWIVYSRRVLRGL